MLLACRHARVLEEAIDGYREGHKAGLSGLGGGNVEHGAGGCEGDGLGSHVEGCDVDVEGAAGRGDSEVGRHGAAGSLNEGVFALVEEALDAVGERLGAGAGQDEGDKDIGAFAGIDGEVKEVLVSA